MSFAPFAPFALNDLLGNFKERVWLTEFLTEVNVFSGWGGDGLEPGLLEHCKRLTILNLYPEEFSLLDLFRVGTINCTSHWLVKSEPL